MLAAVSSDIDTLESIYKGQGCRRPAGYTFAELHMGLENFARFLDDYDIKATLFMVGRDFEREKNHGVIRAMSDAGHEIANHTYTHSQGFRFLSTAEKESEIARMEELCQAVIGRRPLGFRAPGWNVGDDTAHILRRHGYLYDSSVFPTSLMPLLKLLHWTAMHKRPAADRSTMGSMRYLFSPVAPYRTAEHALGQSGKEGIVEIPITVTPVVRLPFLATFVLETGFRYFEICYRWLRTTNRPIQFQMHLSDFVDYSHPALSDQVPQSGDGQYVPRALFTPLPEKLNLWRRVFDLLEPDCHFERLDSWAANV
jgi:hypothetical protein